MFARFQFGFGGTRRASAFGGAYEASAEACGSGLIGGTRLATEHGFRAVETLVPGDLVLTFDNGLRRIRAIERRRLWSGEARTCPRRFWPLHIPRGLIGNRDAMQVLPGQVVMVESDIAESLLGDPFVLLPGAALAELRDVEAVPSSAPVEVIRLQFDTDEVVFSNASVQFLCPAMQDMLTVAADRGSLGSAYSPLSHDRARALIRAETGTGEAERRVA